MQIIIKNLNDKYFSFQKDYKDPKSAFHLFILSFKKKISVKLKNKFYENLKKGINLDIKYRPIQDFSYYKKILNEKNHQTQ